MPKPIRWLRNALSRLRSSRERRKERRAFEREQKERKRIDEASAEKKGLERFGKALRNQREKKDY